MNIKVPGIEKKLVLKSIRLMCANQVKDMDIKSWVKKKNIEEPSRIIDVGEPDE